MGIVTGEKSRCEQYQFNTDEYSGSLLELKTEGNYHPLVERNDDEAECLIPMEWDYAVEAKQAFLETGLFGNQNTVCKPRASEWQHTVERLKVVWRVS